MYHTTCQEFLSEPKAVPEWDCAMFFKHSVLLDTNVLTTQIAIKG